MSKLSNKKALLLLILLMAISFIPWLGLTDFNTKGEPREAIVAYSMIDSNNWILPENNGGEMAYKPPFFHWCIASASSVIGNVNEYVSRFPSALAAIFMLVACFLFFSKGKDTRTSFLAVFITFTSFEVHRAAYACRVDMVLTACIVGALIALASWAMKRKKLYLVMGIVCMSLGTLTKGPVAIILPCAVAGIYELIKGRNFWKVAMCYMLAALLALIIPAVWYYAAWKQGGDEFLSLVAEENVGRFLGKMSYPSHENPWIYNVITVIAGYLPWTILLLFSLFSLKYKPVRMQPVKSLFTRLMDRLRSMNPYTLYSLLAFVVIFIFYCIPKSKRSVYLLPIYPFLGYFIAIYLLWLQNNGKKCVKAFGWVIASICTLLLLTFFAVKVGIVPQTIFSGRHAAENISYMQALAAVSGWWRYIILLMPLAGVVYWACRRNIKSIMAMIFVLFLSFDAVLQPAVMNVKSDHSIARKIDSIVPEGPIESFVNVGMMHYFTINFYLNNRVGVFDENKATDGYFIVGDVDDDVFLPRYSSRYKFEPIYTSDKRSCDTKQRVVLYRYTKIRN